MTQQQDNGAGQRDTVLEQELDSALSGAKETLRQKVGLARTVLFWEEVWPRLAVLLTVMAAFMILSLYGVWSVVPSPVHRLGLLAFLLAGIWAVIRVIRSAWPGRDAALRRLEQASNLPHRPASSFGDSLADISADTAQSGAATTSTKLWIAHRLRLAKMFAGLRAGWPKTSLERFDPYALRALTVMLLLFGLALHGTKSWQVIKGAVAFSTPASTDGIRIDAWLTPPVFTGKNPVMLSDGSTSLKQDAPAALDPGGHEKQFEVPENARLVVRIIGKGAGDYAVRQTTGDQTTGDKAFSSLPFDREENGKGTGSSPGLKKLSYKLKHSVRIEILQDDRVVRSWPIAVTEDITPAISLTKNPEKTPRSALLLTYQIADDYGVARAQARIMGVIRDNGAGKQKRKQSKKSGNPEKQARGKTDEDLVAGLGDGRIEKMAPLGKPASFDLKLPVSSLTRGEAKTYRNLTAHPWAGLPVQMQLVATDQAGQEGRSETLVFKLPERKFTKSLARAIIELRRYLVLNPSEHFLVAKGLDVLTHQAVKQKIDRTAYLSLRNIYWRIRHLQRRRFESGERATVRSVVDQMWETALRIEDGNLSRAERDLRRAQDKLADAISRNASPEEISRLMKELRQALGRYMQAMRQQQKTMQNAQKMPPQNGQGQQQSITGSDLDKMLKRIEQMARTGSKDAAQQMLNRLRDMLESLQNPQQQNADNARNRKMMELMDKFGKLARQQQKLQEKTFQENRQNMRPQGENNRFSRYNRFDRQRPWNPRPGQNGQRGRPGDRPGQFSQRRQDNPYYRRGQGQRGLQGQGQGRNGNEEQGLRSQDRQGGNSIGKPGSRGGEGRFTQKAEKLAREQRGLQRQLDNLMNELGRMGGAAPRELGKARKQMGQAGKSLGQKKLGNAADAQGKALENLRKAAKKMTQQMMKKMARGFRPGGRDPLGRQRGQNGFDPGNEVEVPDEIDTQRAREILEELRRRLGQAKRSPAELDYLESLIKRF